MREREKMHFEKRENHFPPERDFIRLLLLLIATFLIFPTLFSSSSSEI